MPTYYRISYLYTNVCVESEAYQFAFLKVNKLFRYLVQCCIYFVFSSVFLVLTFSFSLLLSLFVFLVFPYYVLYRFCFSLILSSHLVTGLIYKVDILVLAISIQIIDICMKCLIFLAYCNEPCHIKMDYVVWWPRFAVVGGRVFYQNRTHAGKNEFI